MWGRISGAGCRDVIVWRSGRGCQRLDETTYERRQGLERLLALLMSRGSACLCGARISQIKGHYPLALGGLRFCGFPEIHTRAQYFKALARVEDPLYVSGTGHVHDPEAESVAPLIPQNLRDHHHSKRGEGLTEYNRHAVRSSRSWTEVSCRHPLPNPEPRRHA